MKYKFLFRLFALFTVIVLSLAIFPPGVAFAATTITPSATSGTVGSTFTLTITSTDFPPNSSGFVRFAPGTDLESQTPLSSNSTGGISSPVTVTVPSIPTGSYTVTATISSTSFSTTFSVTPRITLSSTSARVGDQITVTGTGFAAAASYTVTFNSAGATTVSAAATSGANGTFSTYFVVPNIVNGTYSVTTASAPAVSMTVNPSLTLSPNSGFVGSTVTAVGRGFGGTIVIFINFDTSAGLSQPLTDQYGTFSTNFAIPASTGGSHTIRATDGSVTATAEFSMSAGANISPTSGPVGTQVTSSGASFSANRLVKIAMDGIQLAQSPTDTFGTFSVTFNIPASTGGAHTLTITDDIFTSNPSFTVTSGVVLSPVSGPPGSQVTVSGSGFKGVTSTGLSLDGVSIATISTDSAGSFGTNAVIPAGAAGSHVFKANDGTYSATSSFTIKPAFTLSAGQGVTGNQITATGAGFAAGTTVTIQSDPGGSVITKVDSDAKGSFTLQFPVPQLNAGSYTFTATDGTNPAGAPFTITASIRATPTAGNAGSKVTVAGTGFSGTVTIKYDSSVLESNVPVSSGAFSKIITVPAGSRGSHIISVSDAALNLQLPFTVTPDFVLNPPAGNVGSSVMVSGTGFNGPINVKYDNAVLASVTAGANGSFSTNITIPASIHGSHTVTVNDSSITLDKKFTMESVAPVAPDLSAPKPKARENSQPAFSWTPVLDASGVTYTLQIATDSAFTKLTLQKTGLTRSEYTVTESEKLKTVSAKNPYYWRVKAIDLAQNESDWSPASSFYVTLIPGWLIWVLIAAGSLVVLFFAARIIMRSRRLH
jgi:hypothetical protein